MSAIQSTLKTQKRILRSATSAQLATIPTPHILSQSLAVINRLYSLPAFRDAKSLSCYLSMPSGEIDTSSIVSEALKTDKTIFVPKIISKSGEMDFLEIYGSDDLSSLPAGVWGIKEPDFEWRGQPRLKALDTPDLDLILLPAVAFDRTFGRLGHGKGFYDRWTSSYHSAHHRRPALVGLALREQVLEGGRIPMAQSDWKMDYIVTPDEILANPDTLPVH